MIMPGKNAKDAKLKKAGNAAAVSAFDKACARLNKAQKEAVDTIEGPGMVVAGPGTGKTQILTLRIANILLQTDTPASGILALTFTEAGQKAMRLKLRQFIGSRADEVAVHTYHSFASSVIADFPDHFPHLARARQLSDVESENLIREILREKKFVKLRPLGDPDLYVGKIGQTISDCRKEAWTPEIVREFAEKVFAHFKLDFYKHLKINPELLRPNEVPALLGDSTKIRAELGWAPVYDFNNLVYEMCEADFILESKTKS